MALQMERLHSDMSIASDTCQGSGGVLWSCGSLPSSAEAKHHVLQAASLWGHCRAHSEGLSTQGYIPSTRVDTEQGWGCGTGGVEGTIPKCGVPQAGEVRTVTSGPFRPSPGATLAWLACPMGVQESGRGQQMGQVRAPVSAAPSHPPKPSHHGLHHIIPD